MTPDPLQPRVRPARPEDVPRLKELGALGWETTYHEFVRPENRAIYLAGEFWSLATLERIIDDPACIVLVSEDDAGQVTGFITVEPISGPGNRVELTRFYVEPTRRRGGIGSALYHAALAASRAHGATTMLVNVFADNAIGRTFYEHAGFTLTELSPTQVGDQIVGDAWYELALSAED